MKNNWFGKDIVWQLAIDQSQQASKSVSRISSSANTGVREQKSESKNLGEFTPRPRAQSSIMHGETLSEMAKKREEARERDENYQIFNRRPLKATEFIKLHTHGRRS